MQTQKTVMLTKMGWNFLLISFMAVFFLVSPAFAGTLSCSITTAAGCAGTVIYRMSGTTNAHAELPSQSTAAYDSSVVCCTGVAGLTTTCSGTFATALKLSGLTNAHGEQNAQANYANSACIQVPGGGSVSVGYQATNCTGFDTTLGSMSAITNAHVGNSAAYSAIQICATAAGSSNTLPVASSVSIDSGAVSVNLVEGTTKNVVCTSVVTDADGFSNIQSVQAKLYRTGVGAGAGDDNANHYTRTGDAQCIPSGGAGTTENYSCTFAVQFYADATDAGSPNSADNWTCQVTPTDTVGPGTASTDTIEMNSLTAADVTANIAYGALALGANTGTTDQTTVVTNTGNRQIDTQLAGYGTAPSDGFSLTCTIGTVVVGNERYSFTAATAWSAKTLLTATPFTETTFNLAAGAASTKNVYWGLGFPTSGVGSSCTGQIDFTAVNG